MAANEDWAALLPELIPIIAKKITDISDFIRFRAVCRSWRSSTTIADLSPQFPWILSDTRGPDLQFYSVVLDKFFTIHAPKFSNENYYEGCHGYMLVRLGDFKLNISLANPLNNTEISLPPLKCGYYKQIGSRNFQNGDYVIMMDEHCCRNSLRVCKPGDEKWVHMKGGDYSYLYTNNLLFKAKPTLISRKNGKVVHGYTKVIDVSTHEKIYVVPEKQYLTLLNEDSHDYLLCSSILVESQGEILKVIYIDEFKKYEIFRLELQNVKENPCWVKITNIGDRMLFLGSSNHYGDFSLRTTDFHGLNFKGNCIYSIRLIEEPDYFLFDRYGVERYDIESGTTEVIHCQERNITWFLPSLNHV